MRIALVAVAALVATSFATGTAVAQVKKQPTLAGSLQNSNKGLLLNNNRGIVTNKGIVNNKALIGGGFQSGGAGLVAAGGLNNRNGAGLVAAGGLNGRGGNLIGNDGASGIGRTGAGFRR